MIETESGDELDLHHSTGEGGSNKTRTAQGRAQSQS